MKDRVAIRLVLFASLYAILYYAYSLFSLQGSLEGFAGRWTSLGYLLGMTFLGGWILVLAGLKLRGSLETKPGRLSVFLTGSFTVIFVVVFSLLGGLLYWRLFAGNVPLEGVRENNPGFLLQVFLLALFTGIIYSVTDHNLITFRHLQELRLATLRLQTEQMNLQFESLKKQISPHFLFNSLNTISSLIYRDAGKAEKFIRNLAGVYLNVLKNYEHPLVPIAEELELVGHYSYLMKVRFEDAFTLDIDLSEGAEKSVVPPLSIQMLIENAIKHNRMSRERPLEISLFSADDYLIVRNNYLGEQGHIKIGNDLYRKPGNGKPTGIGLQNIRNRYRMLSRKPVLISKDEYFTVSLPLIPANE